MHSTQVARPYTRDFRPMPDVPALSLAPYEPHGWKLGRLDNTSDAGDREYAARCDDIRTRQWREMDASTLGDVAHDERLAESVRKGAPPAEVGKVLLQLLHERVEAIVRSNA